MKLIIPETAAKHPPTTADPTPAGAVWNQPDPPGDLLAHVACYAEHGMALVAIEKGTKAPKTKGWQTTQPEAPAAAVARFRERPGCGVGVVLGTSSPELCDLDIDNMDGSIRWCADHGIDLGALLNDPTIPRTEGKPGRAKLLFLAPAGLATRKVGEAAGSHALELRAGGVQDVLPPTMHPDTGKPYRWLEGRAPWETGGFPMLPAALEAVWRAEMGPQRTTQDAPYKANGRPANGNGHVRPVASSACRGVTWDDVRFKVNLKLGGARGVLKAHGVKIGRDGKALSPFRNETNPSLQVLDDGRYTDFGGPAPRGIGTTDSKGNGAGDAIDLEAQYRNLTSGKAVVQLARLFPEIKLPPGRPSQWGYADLATEAAATDPGEPPDYGEVPPPSEAEAPAKGGKQKAERSESQADRLVQLALAAQASGELLLFVDSAGVPCAQAVIEAAGDVPKHREVYRINGQGFKRYLSRRLFEAIRKPGTADALKTATLLLEAFACQDGPRFTLSNRVARYDDDALYYDLTNGAHTAVRTTPDGWNITEPPRPMFQRFAHQLPQVDPVHDGDIWRLFYYVSVTDPDHQLLLLTWLVAAYVPGWPHPMPVMRGPQGSGKSGALGFLRRLIDPSQTATVNIPRDLEDLIQVLAHNWFCPFDNITAIHEWVNDALCRAVTGDGFSKRQLYTDDEDVIYSFQRVIGLGGITIAGMRPDLIDRCINIELARIPKERRLTEKPLKDRFERDLPGILGGIFDTLVKALRYLPEVKLEEHPRMADFAEFGCAVARALGKTADDFLRIYGADQARALDEAIDADPVASAILALMDNCPEFKGTPADVLIRLIAEARVVGIDTDAKSWPSDASVMTRAMKRAEATMQDKGIGFEVSRGKHRMLRIYHRTTAQ
jgi:hypothetical protein